MGTRVASAIYSAISSICVQLASLLSRTPSEAEIARPLAQMALNPASSAIRAERPLCASSIKSNRLGSSKARNCFVLDIKVLTGMEKSPSLSDEPRKIRRG